MAIFDDKQAVLLSDQRANRNSKIVHVRDKKISKGDLHSRLDNPTCTGLARQLFTFPLLSSFKITIGSSGWNEICVSRGYECF